MSVREIHIVIPAWGRHYIRTAAEYTIPAAIAALRAHNAEYRAVFWVYSDDPEILLSQLRHFETIVRERPKEADENGFHGLNVAHKALLAEAPEGSIVTLLNADIVVSREVFAYADMVFDQGKRVIASVGHRSLIRNVLPPIGASARQLLNWCWNNRHPITQDSIFNQGKTNLPTVCYFVQGQSVVMHCFHLCPVMSLKDSANRKFIGTIDDDLLSTYAEHQIVVPGNREIAFAELSPAHKQFRTRNEVMNIDFIVEFGRRFRKEHVRNFKSPIRVFGESMVDTSPVQTIVDRLGT